MTARQSWRSRRSIRRPSLRHAMADRRRWYRIAAAVTAVVGAAASRLVPPVSCSRPLSPRARPRRCSPRPRAPRRLATPPTTCPVGAPEEGEPVGVRERGHALSVHAYRTTVSQLDGDAPDDHGRHWFRSALQGNRPHRQRLIGEAGADLHASSVAARSTTAKSTVRNGLGRPASLPVPLVHPRDSRTRGRLHPEHRVAVDVGRARDEQVRGDGPHPRRGHREVDVGRPVRMPGGRRQQFAHGPVNGNRVVPRNDGTEPRSGPAGPR